MFVFKAAVVGAGTMGSEIAQVIASAEFPVVLQDVEQELVDQGLANARSLWQGRVDAGKMEASELERKLALITGTTRYDAFGDVDLVIEAVPERIEVKQSVFSALDEVTPGHAVLCSTTSSLSITEIGEATGRPDKVVGLHFVPPASVTRLVEVAEGDDTSPETAATASSFAQAIRKTPIRCAEAPGLVLERILTASASELWRLQEESAVSVKEIDEVLTDSKAASIGPFRRADLQGLDRVLQIVQLLEQSYGDRFYVHKQLRELVAAGDLGAKTGRGFYEHGN